MRFIHFLNVLLCTLFSTSLQAASFLFPTMRLDPGQRITSPSGAYTLIMQTDGSLVLYRQDGSIRYRMAKRGRYSVMQGDGNLVEYDGAHKPVWSSGTGNNPGAWLLLQDDGNLVIYSSSQRPIWHIGPDREVRSGLRVGDVLGRDLAVPFLGWIGHVGLWEGDAVAEAMPGQPVHQAIRLSALENFNQVSASWGTAAISLSDYTVMYPWNCIESWCSLYSPRLRLSNREAIKQRIHQIIKIGADYSDTAVYERMVHAEPGSEYGPRRRGLYRCDTFVWDAIMGGAFATDYSDAPKRKWIDLLFDLRYGTSNPERTPRSLFNAIRAFRF